MKILIVSDTHAKHGNLDYVLEQAGSIDLFIHLGDVEGDEEYLDAVIECEKHIVRGNNDFFSRLPREEEFDIGKYHVFITHGHYYYGCRYDHRRGKIEKCRYCDVWSYA